MYDTQDLRGLQPHGLIIQEEQHSVGVNEVVTRSIEI